MNNVNLIGKLTRDPRWEGGASGGDLCSMQIAVQRRGPRGEPEPGVLYVEVVSAGVQARECASELEEGMRVGVTGRLERRERLAGDGSRIVSWEVHAYQLDMLDARSADEG